MKTFVQDLAEPLPAPRRYRAVAVLVVAGALLGSAPSAVADPPLVQPRNIGGGDARGTITYPAATPLPQALAPCRATTFTFQASAEAFVLNTAIAGFAGPVTIDGSGSAFCENASNSGGMMTLRLTGVNTTTKSTLSCPVLGGGYTRVLSEMTLILSGNCIVNNYAQGIVNFVAKLSMVPSGMNGGAPFTAPVTSATTAGAFVIAPA